MRLTKWNDIPIDVEVTPEQFARFLRSAQGMKILDELKQENGVSLNPRPGELPVALPAVEFQNEVLSRLSTKHKAKTYAELAKEFQWDPRAGDVGASLIALYQRGLVDWVALWNGKSWYRSREARL